MKSHLYLKFTFSFLLLLLLSGCKKASEEVIESIGKKITKETIETSTELTGKTVIKSLTRESIKLSIAENGLNQSVLKCVLKNLSNDEIKFFINDSKNFTSNFAKFNNNPDLVLAYKKLINSKSCRTNISYLYQTENWIRKGSKGNLILEVPHNINKKLLGQQLNNVRFIKKIIPIEGLHLSVIVPDFTKFRVYTSPVLNPVFFKSSDKIQFSICRANLRKDYLLNPKKIEALLMAQNERYAANGGLISEGRLITKPEEMLQKQINDILQKYPGKQQERIFGFVWHHNEDVGIIDLVADDKHNAVKHIGGRNIWGGGTISRR